MVRRVNASKLYLLISKVKNQRKNQYLNLVHFETWSSAGIVRRERARCSHYQPVKIDLSDLDFVAIHADIIGYSFVQRSADIELLQQELDKRSQGRLSRPAIVAKIETAILQGRGSANAVSNLPELIIYICFIEINIL